LPRSQPDRGTRLRVFRQRLKEAQRVLHPPRRGRKLQPLRGITMEIVDSFPARSMQRKRSCAASIKRPFVVIQQRSEEIRFLQSAQALPGKRL